MWHSVEYAIAWHTFTWDGEPRESRENLKKERMTVQDTVQVGPVQLIGLPVAGEIAAMAMTAVGFPEQVGLVPQRGLQWVSQWVSQ